MGERAEELIAENAPVSNGDVADQGNVEVVEEHVEMPEEKSSPIIEQAEEISAKDDSMAADSAKKEELPILTTETVFIAKAEEKIPPCIPSFNDPEEVKQYHNEEKEVEEADPRDTTEISATAAFLVADSAEKKELPILNTETVFIPKAEEKILPCLLGFDNPEEATKNISNELLEEENSTSSETKGAAELKEYLSEENASVKSSLDPKMEINEIVSITKVVDNILPSELPDLEISDGYEGTAHGSFCGVIDAVKVDESAQSQIIEANLIEKDEKEIIPDIKAPEKEKDIEPVLPKSTDDLENEQDSVIEIKDTADIVEAIANAVEESAAVAVPEINKDTIEEVKNGLPEMNGTESIGEIDDAETSSLNEMTKTKQVELNGAADLKNFLET